MLPVLEFSFLGHTVPLPTSLGLMAIYILFAITAQAVAFKGRIAWPRLAGLTLMISLAGIIGARLVHVAFVRPEILHDPREIFFHFDGLVFYGGLLIGAVAAFSLAPLLVRRMHLPDLYDQGTLLAAGAYGFLRIGCFFNGCCWGSISGHPWAVQYFDPRSAMPALGIPVHPVQLYDAAFGFALLAGLWMLKRRMPEIRGRLFWVFLTLYPVGRYITEMFRGDAIRGVNTLGTGLSFSQLVSVVLITAMGAYWLRLFVDGLNRQPAREIE